MWPFKRIPTKAALECHKKLRINGWDFVIKKINPLIDFKDGNMPQIFTSFVSKRNAEKPVLHQATITKLEDQMKSVIEAGLVSPKLSPRGTKNEITVDDLFRDQTTMGKLYLEIFMHSLNSFKGLKGFFMSLRIRYLLYILSRKNTGNFLQNLSLSQENSQ